MIDPTVLSLKTPVIANIDITSVAPRFCWVKALIPLNADEAIAFVYEDARSYFLLHIVGEQVHVHAMPACIIEELTTAFGRHDVMLTPCLVGRQFGVLVCDRALYLFSNMEETPMRYPISNPFVSPDGDLSRPCVAVAAGYSRDARTPVVFRHQNFFDSRPYFSLLEIDTTTKTARWCHRTVENLPLHLHQPGAGAGSEIWDVSWTGSDYRVFCIGDSSNYARYGMSCSTLMHVAPDGIVSDVEVDFAEDCFGNIAADLEHMIVTPLYSSGTRKGRQTVYLPTEGVERSLKLPRGYASFKLHNIAHGRYWLSNNTRWPHKCALSFVACAVQ